MYRVFQEHNNDFPLYIGVISLILWSLKEEMANFMASSKFVLRKRHFKLELCVRLSVLRLFHVDHVLQNRRSAFSLA